MKTPPSAKGFPGLLPLAGVLLFAIMTLTLSGLSEGVVNHEPITASDVRFSNWLLAHRSPWLTSAMFMITSLGATGMVIGVTVIFLAYLLWRRRYYWFAAVVPTVFGGMLLNRLLKYAFQRPRPHFDDPILSLTNYSFPSGHTMAAAVLYGVLAAYFLAQAEDWPRRTLIIFAAALLITLVGFSRIYLGAHYLTDVLGAMAEGLAWLSLCLTLVYFVWRKRHGQSA